LAGADEGQHMGHADFRVGGKIVATLGYPDRRYGTIMLSPDDQELLIRDHPKRVRLRSGWRRHGSVAHPHRSIRREGERNANTRPQEFWIDDLADD